eukprot:CAMPEP_0119188796 /NCGR_PEP_ID=MMETSP1316-20130426/304_1 /TAXON_ID=41880 /ORGANISM="Pycnococcus provasolii, Strain RCC2336" /LENGTH=193 /DNA_ID=CAMNT_0007183311 /DNA_START=28 /DNA_END=609 /DNA_ORIENTATION=+
MPGDTEQLAVVDGVGPGTAAAGSGAEDRSKAHASSQPTTQSSAQVTKRLQSELMALMTSAQNDGVSAFPDGDNIFIWIGTIVGGAGTVYENLSYKLSLKFPVDYPFQPPTVKFETPCFHPNVDQYGNICLDILREKWSASYTVRTILLSIQSLLGEPNNESPLNGYAAHLWSNEEEYLKVLTKKYQEAVGTNK